MCEATLNDHGLWTPPTCTAGEVQCDTHALLAVGAPPTVPPTDSGMVSDGTPGAPSAQDSLSTAIAANDCRLQDTEDDAGCAEAQRELETLTFAQVAQMVDLAVVLNLSLEVVTTTYAISIAQLPPA